MISHKIFTQDRKAAVVYARKLGLHNVAGMLETSHARPQTALDYARRMGDPKLVAILEAKPSAPLSGKPILPTTKL